jgi:predicted ATP-dependent serine protease
MFTCPNCNATLPENAGQCSNCGTAINAQAAPQPQAAPQGSPDNLSARLEKALRRTELLSYAAAGLGIAILAILIGIAFV